MHWESAYKAKPSTAVSWFQPHPEQSLQFVEKCGLGRDAPILDVGAGASTLVGWVVDAGVADVSVLDISAVALHEVRRRLGARAAAVAFIEANVLAFEPQRKYALWHDRATFHFLTDAGEQQRYVKLLRQGLQADGYLLLATFGPEGPLRCSGLPVQRYGVAELQELLGSDFTLCGHILHDHRTPAGSEQQFQYSCWQFVGDTTKSEA